MLALLLNTRERTARGIRSRSVESRSFLLRVTKIIDERRADEGGEDGATGGRNSRGERGALGQGLGRDWNTRT